MEFYNVAVDVLGVLFSDGMAGTVFWILTVQLIFAVIIIWIAIRSLRKSAGASEFSTAFYVKKKRYGINVMDDRPYDYLK
ncbi:hypothetical protein [Maridesulfovibrio salexigens]|uniref:Uncharacterized protein n=1 Tax=Maridesulfovibrio salexigens (strain ATCC 14822 / DSM 2638 / NCIMB 8403 / VKM B-1763) TaxID=526222 RepID=C6C1U0_MARSD|nr:hypothetical protein [Maridesulfovibrio salexigens]ACS79336.1 hypothetical protein Desal_1273 [Maridesulfovibrio salexigens DSM 2638]